MRKSALNRLRTPFLNVACWEILVVERAAHTLLLRSPQNTRLKAEKRHF
jgi:hypothetical protein